MSSGHQRSLQSSPAAALCSLSVLYRLPRYLILLGNNILDVALPTFHNSTRYKSARRLIHVPHRQMSNANLVSCKVIIQAFHPVSISFLHKRQSSKVKQHNSRTGTWTRYLGQRTTLPLETLWECLGSSWTTAASLSVRLMAVFRNFSRASPVAADAYYGS